MNKYKVGDKIVLTVSDVNEKAYYSYYVFNNNDLILWEPSTDKYAEPLSTYTEPLEAKIHRQAAEITRLLVENEKLKAENGNVIWEIEQAFDRGCNAAWELARKIAVIPKDGGYGGSKLIEIFNTALNNEIFNLTYPEAAAKVAEWEKAKEEIKVGDVVKNKPNTSVEFCVTQIDYDGYLYGVGRGGTTYSGKNPEYWEKTGRHIDIDGFLKQIGGGDDEK